MPTALPYNFQGQNENGNWKASSKEWATKWKKGKNHCFLWQVASKSSASVAHQAASEGKSHGDLRDFSRFFHDRTLQSFRIAANWHVDLRLLAIPYFLFFLKASNTAIFSAEDSLVGKYATLVSHKMAVLGHNFSFSQMNISMDVRPKVYGRTS